MARAEATKTRIFRGAKPKVFEAIRGPLTKAERKGKYLLLTFGEQGVLAHLGMTGKFVKRPPTDDVPYSRARWVLDSGDVIHFRDPRMFGRIEPAPAEKLWQLDAVAALVVDPLLDGLTPQALKEAVGQSKQELKVALMDQGRVTGLGNIHATEALYRAKLHPRRQPAPPRGNQPPACRRRSTGRAGCLPTGGWVRAAAIGQDPVSAPRRETMSPRLKCLRTLSPCSN